MMSTKIPTLAIAVPLTLAGLLAGEIPHAGLAGLAQPSPLSSHLIAQSPTPVTQITEINKDKIQMQITEGEFRFKGYLKRSSGNTFIGQDKQVRVMYDRDTKRIVVINVVTGTEFYNYFFSDVNEGEL